MRVLTSLFLATLLVPRSPFTDIQFIAGEPAALQAKVVGAAPLFDGAISSLVEVQVKNTGSAHAEPLVFRFAPRKGKAGFEAVEARRVEFPHHARAGHGVAPGEQRDYSVVVQLDAALAKTAEVSVRRASFADAGYELDAPVRLGRVRRDSEFRDEYQRTIRVTHVELTNLRDVTLDAVFRAAYSEPQEATTLLEFRLAPNETRTFKVEELRSAGDAAVIGAEVKKLELVDWSAVLPRDSALAVELFTRAYERWYALPADAPTLRARFAFESSSAEGRLAVEGRLWLDAAGGVELLPTAPFDPKARDAARSALMDVLELVRRPAASAVLAASPIELEAWGETSIVHFETAIFDDGQRNLHLALRDDRIVSTDLSPESSTPCLWHTRDEGDGYVVTGRDLMTTFQAAPMQSERTEYVRLGAFMLPSSYRLVFTLEKMPEAERRVSLALTDWVVDADARPREQLDPPTGPLAERLRSAWDGAYRYPDDTVELSGRFAIDHPGTDGVWLGHREVTGSFTLHGFRGARWQSYTIEIDGKKLGESERLRLAEAVDDRFRMFAGRDFCGRGSFESAFAGAKLEAEGDRLRSPGASVVELELAQELPVRVVWSGGLERRFEWTQIGGADVPKVLRSGKEEIAATWTKLSDGWLWPKKIVFRDVFADWGPETLTLDKLNVRRAD